MTLMLMMILRWDNVNFMIILIWDDVDDVEVETLFTVRKSPAENGNVASDKISSAGGLGEGSPKVCI